MRRSSRWCRASNVDPFDEHNLPLRSRNTSLLLNQLQRQAGVTFARVASLDDLYSEAITLDMLFEFAHQHTDLGIQQLARNALIALCTDYLRCANAEARGLAVRLGHHQCTGAAGHVGTNRSV